MRLDTVVLREEHRLAANIHRKTIPRNAEDLQLFELDFSPSLACVRITFLAGENKGKEMLIHVSNTTQMLFTPSPDDEPPPPKKVRP